MAHRYCVGTQWQLLLPWIKNSHHNEAKSIHIMPAVSTLSLFWQHIGCRWENGRVSDIIFLFFKAKQWKDGNFLRYLHQKLRTQALRWWCNELLSSRENLLHCWTRKCNVMIVYSSLSCYLKVTQNWIYKYNFLWVTFSCKSNFTSVNGFCLLRFPTH